MNKDCLLLAILLGWFVSINCSAAESHLPNDADATLNYLYQKYKNEKSGKNADYIPELSKADPKSFGIVIVTVDGEFKLIGDATTPFAIESISKPFVYALALQDNGEQVVSNQVGLNATGQSFNSIVAIEERPKHIQNPLVNAGAIQTTSLIKGNTSAEKWQRVLDLMKNASDNNLYLGDAVYQSEMATNQRNRSIAMLLGSYGMMHSDPLDAVDRYTKACSVMITAKQLAIMGATLANKGVNPLTHRAVFTPRIIQDVLSEMVINGLYENSGAWFWTVGIPAKSGVGGAILAVVPNKMAIVVYSPPLDKSGNSVRAQLVIQELSQKWGLHLLRNE